MSAFEEWNQPTDAGEERDPDPHDPPRAPYYAHLEDFVGDYLFRIYRRALTGPSTAWCPQWWRHPEAEIRLDALWRSWEHLRADPATGISVWLKDHADHHMGVLLSSDGPFKGCTPDGHGDHPLRPLPVQMPPEQLRTVNATQS